MLQANTVLSVLLPVLFLPIPPMLPILPVLSAGLGGEDFHDDDSEVFRPERVAPLLAVVSGDLEGLRRDEREAALGAARLASERFLAGAVANRDMVALALGRSGRQRLHSPDDAFALAAALAVPQVLAISARRLSSGSVRVTVHSFDARSRRELTMRVLVARPLLSLAVESMTWELLAGERAREAARDPDGTLAPSFAAPLLAPTARRPSPLPLSASSNSGMVQ